MARHVVDGAVLACTFGTTPSTLGVLPKDRAWSTTPAATILDHVPNTNIRPFGMCISLANPQVASATSAASGVLTPQPCIPCTASPWTPGVPANTLGGAPILNDTSILACNWGGVITVTDAGQQTAKVP
ncbi:DUF4280 domain-containing protein [Roseomonas rosulenta]|uniref:DUF4280 domain-containing protein n=1 Tax=Roseomonas rosulenta TaxID=2748667 RepID=UPI0018DFDA93|nr:DUF4280 domain-containing protein [Roseomonas rosulenta]